MSLVQIDRNPPPSRLRNFAFLCLAFSAIAARRFDQPWSWSVVAAGLGVTASAWLAPSWLKRVYVGAQLLTAPIGWVVGHVLLGIVFYGVVTPIGLVLRATRGDWLGRRFDASQKSYWSVRDGTPKPERYLRQF